MAERTRVACEAEGCGRPARNQTVGGGCVMHATRMDRHGSYDADRPKNKPRPRKLGSPDGTPFTCEATCGCDHPSSNQTKGGLCVAHQQQRRKRGAPGPDRPLRPFGGDFPLCIADGCFFTSRTQTPGPCTGHYQRKRNRGRFDEHIPLQAAAKKADIRLWVERLLSSDWPESCVIWPFARTSSGYGAWNTAKESAAHRSICRLVYGHPAVELPDVAHSCGNGDLGCVNPLHLRWSSHSGNMVDAAHHGTLRSVKLTPAQVGEIKAAPPGELHIAVARHYPVGPCQIGVIRRGTCWAEVVPTVYPYAA